MSNHERKLNKYRTIYQTKLRQQLDELMFISQDQDQLKHRQQVVDIHSTITILWRFDQKLALLRSSLAAHERRI